MNRRYLITLFLVSFPNLCHYAQDAGCINSFSIAWENDIFNGQDYYYSNGIQLNLHHQKIGSSPLNYILPFPGNSGEEDMLYGLHLKQEIYTPRDLEEDSISPGDHPYVATLSLVESKTVLRSDIGLMYTSEIRIGVLGPAAQGLFFQTLAHRVSNPSRPPQGWDYQIQNDLILNLNLTMDKRLFDFESSMMGIKTGLRIGTLHSDFSGGIWWRLDPDKCFFERKRPVPEKKFEIRFLIGGTGRYVIYDATLQGGMFNKDSPHIIPAASITRFVPELNVLLVFEFEKHELHFYENLASHRFDNAVWHSWMGIKYSYWW